MNISDGLNELLGIVETDSYGKLRDRLIHGDDCLLEELVALRKSKQLTQDEVAKEMGRSKTAVSNFERLGSDPHLSTIRRYAAAIGALVTHQVEDYDRCRAGLAGPVGFEIVGISGTSGARSSTQNEFTENLIWSPTLVVRRELANA